MELIKEDYADRSDKLQNAKQLLEKAKADFRDKNSRFKALEAHLDESRNEISRLTRQLDYFKEEYESFQEELKHAYELRYLTTKPKESAAASRRSSYGLDLKDLDKLARNIGKFNPSVPNSQNVQAYLQDIDSIKYSKR